MKKRFEEWIKRVDMACEAMEQVGQTYNGAKNVPKEQFVFLDILKRIKANLRGCRDMLFELTKLDPEKDNFEKKIPLSILLRSCLADAMVGMYLASLTKQEFAEELDVINLDFVRYMGSMIPLEVELYNRLSGKEINFQEELDIRYDGFSQFLSSDKGKPWTYNKASVFRADKTNDKRVDFPLIRKSLIESEVETQAFAYMYNYYRYYSQYEHFTSIGREIWSTEFAEEITRMEMSFISVIHSCYLIAKKLPKATDDLLRPFVVVINSIVP